MQTITRQMQQDIRLIGNLPRFGVMAINTDSDSRWNCPEGLRRCGCVPCAPTF